MNGGERVLDALDQLPPDQKAALVLVDMEGYPVAEAAEMLDTPTGHGEEPLLRGAGPGSRCYWVTCSRSPPEPVGASGCVPSRSPDPADGRAGACSDKELEGQ